MPLITIVFVLLTLITSGLTYAATTPASRQGVLQNNSATDPNPGELFCSVSPCERITQDKIVTNVAEKGKPYEVDVMWTQEFQNTYKIAHPLPSNSGALGPHYVLDTPAQFGAVCHSNAHLCVTEMNKRIQALKKGITSYTTCAHQPSPFTQLASQNQASVDPLVLTKTQKILFTATIVYLFGFGAGITAIGQLPLKSIIYKSLVGGVFNLIAGLLFLIIANLTQRAEHGNNNYGFFEAMGGMGIAVALGLGAVPVAQLPGANAQCAQNIQIAVAEQMCFDPIPAGYAVYENQTCYAREQRFA